MIIRRDEMRASKIMQQRVQNANNIEILWNSLTDEILGENEVESVRIVNKITGEKKEIPIQGFFVAIGHTPNTEIFSDYLEIDPQGYIKTLPGTTRTNIPGVFAAGDVQDKMYRQAVTAAGSGCMAALDAEKFLAEKELETA
jgi:thioredoxin reductase (NADPH)